MTGTAISTARPVARLTVQTIALLPCTVLPLTVPAQATRPDTTGWTCSQCPFPDGVDTRYGAGVGTVSDDAARFGSGNGHDEAGAYLNLDSDGAWHSLKTDWRWQADDVGIDAWRLALDGRGADGWHVAVDLVQLPYRRFDTTQTPYVRSSAGALALPADWLRAPVTAGMTALAPSLRNVDIGTDRQTLTVNGSWLDLRGVDLAARYRHERRDGTDLGHGATFTSAVELPRPIDYRADTVELSAARRIGDAELTLGWSGSQFRNLAWAQSWDNPFTGLPGATRLSQAEPPDNRSQRVALTGLVPLGDSGWRASFVAAAGRLTQDDRLLPYTVNPAVPASTLPRQRLDGRVDTTTLSLRLSGRLHRRATARIHAAYDDRDSRTPVDTWTRVIVDSFDSGETEANVPYSFERRRVGARVDIDLPRRFDLALGGERLELDRNFQEVSGHAQTTGWAKLRWRSAGSAAVSARAGTEKREHDGYDTSLAAAFGQNPLLRKYHLADRFREFAELDYTVLLPGTPVSVALDLGFTDDDYTESLLGLTGSQTRRVGAGLDWPFGERTTLSVDLGWDRITADQAGSNAFADSDWQARTEDRFRSLGGALTFAGQGDRPDIALEYRHSTGDGTIALSGMTGPFASFPDIETKQHALSARLGWPLRPNLYGVLKLRYERFDSDDWALDGVGPDTVPTLLSMGADAYDYDVVLFEVGVRYRVGDAGQ